MATKDSNEEIKIDRSVVVAKISPKSDIYFKLLPHYTHIRCSKSYAFHNGLVEVEQAS